MFHKMIIIISKDVGTLQGFMMISFLFFVLLFTTSGHLIRWEAAQKTELREKTGKECSVGKLPRPKLFFFLAVLRAAS